MGGRFGRLLAGVAMSSVVAAGFVLPAAPAPEPEATTASGGAAARAPEPAPVPELVPAKDRIPGVGVADGLVFDLSDSSVLF